jgi:hypothetical protein
MKLLRVASNICAIDKGRLANVDTVRELIEFVDGLAARITNTNLKYDEFPKYDALAEERLRDYLKPEDVNIVIEYLDALAARKSGNYYNVDFSVMDSYDRVLNSAKRGYQDLVQKLKGRSNIIEKDVAKRLEEYKTRKDLTAKEEKIKHILEEIERTGDLSLYDQINHLEGRPKSVHEVTPLEDYHF